MNFLAELNEIKGMSFTICDDEASEIVGFRQSENELDRFANAKEREMSEHTPGPWKYGHKGFAALWVGPDYDQLPTAIVPWDCEDARASARENAKLIAAAPVMHAALLNIQAMAERGFPIDNAKLAKQCFHALNGSQELYYEPDQLKPWR